MELDTCLSEQKKKAAQIGGLMKEGRREEADAVKADVAALKTRSAEIEKKSESRVRIKRLQKYKKTINKKGA